MTTDYETMYRNQVAEGAELRAALVALESCVVWSDSTQSFGLYQRVKGVLGPARALLARTDLGRGMVAVPREMVERVPAIVQALRDNDNAPTHEEWRAVRGILADLAALLDGGKEHG